MSRPGLEEELARFVTETRWSELGTELQRRVNTIFVDAIANAIAGRLAQTTPLVEELLRGLSGDGNRPIVAGNPASPTAAAYVNAHQITAFTMCDVYRPALCHITPVLVPPLLDIAGEQGASGEELLSAFAVGLEVTARLGRAINYPSFRARGWHSPGVIGPIGAAAASTRLLGGDAQQVRRSMGLAVSQAAGTFAALGTPAVKFHQARGAVAGLWAARFVAGGYLAPLDAISARDGGLLVAYCDDPTPGEAVEGLGSSWEIDHISLRRWPAASSLQSLVAAAIELHEELELYKGDEAPGGGVETVDGVEVALPTTSYAMCAKAGWEDELAAMQSARFVAAVVFSKGVCWIEQFGEASRRDPALGQLASEVVVVEDSTLPPAGCRVRIRLVGGREFENELHDVPGSPEAPLRPEDVLIKLERAIDSVPIQDPAAVMDAVAAPAQITDSGSLLQALAGGSRPAQDLAPHPSASSSGHRTEEGS